MLHIEVAIHGFLVNHGHLCQFLVNPTDTNMTQNNFMSDVSDTNTSCSLCFTSFPKLPPLVTYSKQAPVVCLFPWSFGSHNFSILYSSHYYLISAYATYLRLFSGYHDDGI